MGFSRFWARGDGLCAPDQIGECAGQAVVVSPIVATSPLWILLGTWLFLQGFERLTLRTILGASAVVSGTIAISLVR